MAATDLITYLSQSNDIDLRTCAVSASESLVAEGPVMAARLRQIVRSDTDAAVRTAAAEALLRVIPDASADTAIATVVIDTATVEDVKDTLRELFDATYRNLPVLSANIARLPALPWPPPHPRPLLCLGKS